MGKLFNLFSKDKELNELRNMLTILSKEHAKLATTVDSLNDDIKQLKASNRQLVKIIIGASDYTAMKTNIRLSRDTLVPNYTRPPVE